MGRAKTFRVERNNNEVDFEENLMAAVAAANGPTSLPVSASMVEVLRHRAKSASRVNDNPAAAEPLRPRRGHKDLSLIHI